MKLWRHYLALAVLAVSMSNAPASADVTYAYDDLGRVSSITYDDGKRVTYSYDPAGNRTQHLVSNTLNQPPTAVNDAQSTPQDTPVTFDPRINDSDPDGDLLTITTKTDGAKGAVSIVAGGGALIYTPNAGQAGIDSFTYTIADTASATATATVTMMIGPNHDPVASPDAVTVAPTVAATINVRINDSDADGHTLTVSNVSTPSKGTAQISGGNVVYTANAGTTGADAFNYTISDGYGGTATATVTITIVPPAGFNQTIQITGTGPVNLRTLANAAGYNGAQDATITFQLANGVIITGGAGGGRAIDTGTWPTGSYTIALNLEVSGKVRGGGGNGANGSGLSGGQGGDGIYCSLPMSVTVNAGGEIKSGGGGGGSGGTKRTAPQPEPTYGGGGGGGGGQPNGSGGAGGVEDTTGQPGSPGTTSAPGAGGATFTAGGTGGAYGATGTAGANGGAGGTSGGAGGAAGYAVRKNGNTVTVTNNGTIVGAVN